MFLQKFQNTTNITIPIILVGIVLGVEKHTKYVSTAEVISFVNSVKALRYFELTTKEHNETEILFNEIARVIVREKKYTTSKLLENLTKLLKEKKPIVKLRKRQIVGLPNSFIFFSHFLEKIDLDANQIRHFPYELIYCTQLREITLNMNFISEIPSEISALQNLTDFELEYNHIDTLPIKSVFISLSPINFHNPNTICYFLYSFLHKNLFLN